MKKLKKNDKLVCTCPKHTAWCFDSSETEPGFYEFTTFVESCPIHGEQASKSKVFYGKTKDEGTDKSQDTQE